MLRPWHVDADSLPLGAVAIVMAGVFTWSLSMINIRQMGDAGERNVTIVSWYSLGTASLAAIGCLFDWVTPTPWQLVTLVSAGLMSGSCPAMRRPSQHPEALAGVANGAVASARPSSAASAARDERWIERVIEAMARDRRARSGRERTAASGAAV